MEYKILEANYERLEKKLKTIEKKCKKYDNNFLFENVKEEYQTIKKDGRDITAKFIFVNVEGIAKINNWQFVATLQTKGSGNIIRHYNMGINVPEKYQTEKSHCQHCNINRNRKDTYLIYNENTKEYKQVGKTCLQAFTNGLNAEYIAMYISVFDELIQAGESANGGNFDKEYINTNDFLLHVSENINKYGYVSKKMLLESENGGITTSQLALENLFIYAQFEAIQREIMEKNEKSNYNENSNENKKEVENALQWIKEANTENNEYLHNLKTVCNCDYIEYKDINLIASLFVSYARAINKIKENAKKIEVAKKSNYIGSENEKIIIEVESVNCIYSYTNDYNAIVSFYKFVDVNENILIWKTSNGYEIIKAIENGNKKIIATVKKHTEYNGEKQTEILRAKIIK